MVVMGDGGWVSPFSRPDLTADSLSVRKRGPKDRTADPLGILWDPQIGSLGLSCSEEMIWMVRFRRSPLASSSPPELSCFRAGALGLAGKERSYHETRANPGWCPDTLSFSFCFQAVVIDLHHHSLPHRLPASSGNDPDICFSTKLKFPALA